MMPEMMTAATAGKVFDGDCHCGAVRFRVTGPVGKILICHCYDCMRTAGLSWDGIDVALDRFDLVKDASLKWYDSSAIAKRGFCDDCGASLFYQLHTASVVAIAPGMFDQSDQFEVAGQIYAASHLTYEQCGRTKLLHLEEVLGVTDAYQPRPSCCQWGSEWQYRDCPRQIVPRRQIGPDFHPNH